MSIRKEVSEFVNLGPLPDSEGPEDKIIEHQKALTKIKGPISDEEASSLMKCFGKDDCFGLAWTLLHLIESAPGVVRIINKIGDHDNEWLKRLWERSKRKTEEI